MEVKASNRKQQIIEEATKLFRTHGYAATSMRDLAHAVGMEAASLYSHFPNKETLLKIICFEVANRFFKAMEQVEAMPVSAELRLRSAIEMHVQIITENTHASGIFLHDWRYLTNPALGEFIGMRNRYERYWVTILEEGVTAGLFIIDDCKFSVRFLLSSLNWLYEWYKPNGNYTPTQLAQKLTAQTLNGFKSKIQ